MEVAVAEDAGPSLAPCDHRRPQRPPGRDGVLSERKAGGRAGAAIPVNSAPAVRQSEGIVGQQRPGDPVTLQYGGRGGFMQAQEHVDGAKS